MTYSFNKLFNQFKAKISTVVDKFTLLNLLTLLGIFSVLTTAVWFLNRTPKEVQAGWYNDNWMYRKAIEITNSGSDQTDFQVDFTLDTASLITDGKMQSDCDDIRITDINGRELPHWIPTSPDNETANFTCNSSTTKIWVKIPSIETSGTVIYVYYGNSSTTNTEKPNEVFEYFEDFSGSNLNPSWEQDSGSWSNETFDSKSTVSIEPSSNSQFLRNDDYNTSSSFILETSSYSTESGDGQAHPGIIFYADNGHNDHVYWRPHSYNTSSNIQVAYYNGSLNMAENFSGIGNWNEWLNTTVKVNGDTAEVFQNGTTKGTRNGLQYDGTYSNIGLVAHNSGKNYWDYLAIRKYAATEPTTSAGSEENSPGPIAYWKFDEGYGGTAYDSTINGNDGSLGTGDSAPEWQSEDMCISGKCLKYDGNDKVSISGNSINNPTEFTVGAWIKLNQFNPNTGNIGSVIFTNYGGSQKGLILYIFDDGRVGTRAHDGISSHDLKSTSSINLNEWAYISTTYNGTNLKVYLNGKEENSRTADFDVNNNNVYIGSWNNVALTYGFIDEVKVYPYARTAEEIKADYASRGSSQGVSATLSTDKSNSDNLSEGLVGYWKMDESSWSGDCATTDVADSSENDNDGAACGDATPEAGKFGNSANTDGSGDRISIADDSIHEPSNVTISAWVKWNGISDDWIIEKHTATPTEYNYGYLIRSDSPSDTVRCRLGNGSANTDISTTITTNTWYHITCTYDGTTAKLYLDGEEKDSASLSGDINYTSVGELSIGSASDGSLGINGSIDEVRIYNRALSPREVRDLYNWAPGPVLHLKADENTGTNTYDSSSNNLSGSLNSGTTWGQGKYGSAFQFDGNDDNVSLSHNSLLEPKSITVNFWANLEDISDRHCLVTKWLGFTTEINSDGTFRWGLNGPTSQYFGSETISWNDWHHLAGTFNDETKEQCIYINGVQTECQTVTGSISYNQSSLYLSGSWDRAKGLLDDIRIYNYARTPKQIVEDMNASHPIGGSPEGSQRLYLKFDRGYDNTVYDSSPYGNTGTLSGTTAPEWTNQGKINKALSFTDYSYVTFGDPTDDSLDIGSGNFTMTAWVKTSSSADWQFIQQKGATSIGNKGYSWSILSSSGVQSMRVTNGSSRPSPSSNTSVTDGNWHHTALVADRDGNATFYLDGIEDGGGDISSGAGDATADDPFCISRPEVDDQFNGIIDEFKLYSTALTEDEIKLDYNLGKSTVMGSISTDSDGSTPSNSSSREYCIPGDTSTCNPPVAEWNFEENTGSDANDTSGNGNTGTLQNMENSDWAVGKDGIGASLNLDGSNEHVTVPSSSDFDFGTGSFSISYSMKYPITQNNAYAGIISDQKWDAGGDNTNWWGLVQSNTDTDAIRYYENLTSDPSFALSQQVDSSIPNGWHHFYLVRDVENNLLKFYRDGTQVFSNSYTLDTNLVSGGLYFGQVQSRYTGGKIDNIEMYDYARTPAQVAWDYNRGKPIGWWKLDDCEGTTADDLSGNGNDGTITIGGSGDQDTVGSCGVGSTAAAWSNGSDGKINASLNFDGSDDKVTITDPAEGELDFGTNGDFSVFTWIKGTDSSGGVVTKREPSTLEGYRIYIFNGKPYSVVDSTGSNCVESTNVDTVNDGNWHQIGLVADRNSNVKFYTDGKLVHTCNTATNDGTVSNDEDLKFGTDRYDSQLYNGQIDDVRIYNYALTDKQVKALYNQNSAVRFSE